MAFVGGCFGEHDLKTFETLYPISGDMEIWVKLYPVLLILMPLAALSISCSMTLLMPVPIASRSYVENLSILFLDHSPGTHGVVLTFGEGGAGRGARESS